MKALGAIGLILLCASARADVADSSAGGFTVKLAVNIQAPPDDVYRKLVRNVGDWWDGGHSFSGNSHNLSIEEKPGGCFCEKLPNGGGARHMEVINFSPGKQLVLTGALGPLQAMAATGTMTIRFQFNDDGGGTELDVVYAVAGYLPAGMNTLAAPVDGVLKQQFGRLKNYVEHGDPARIIPAPDTNRPTRSLSDKTH